MIPGRGLLRLLAMWVAMAALVLVWPWLALAWQLVGVALAALAVLGAIEIWRPPDIVVERRLAPALPLGEWSDVSLRLISQAERRISLEMFDHLPATADNQGLPATVELDPGAVEDIGYRLRPRRRGNAVIDRLEVWRRSTGDLMRKRFRLGEAHKVRVLPNFRPVLLQGLAGLEARMAEHGVHLQRRRGEGLEFEQLRDYRAGDTMRQIDWKATARRGQLISRQYQDERNQQLVLLLDCGRRMHAREGDLTHFDHVLNASLLLAYVAIRQGDAVGVQSFAGDRRWLPPVRGGGAVEQVLDALHDLQTTTRQPDFLDAASRLMERQRHRALVLLVTNLRDEDTDDLLIAIRALRERHLVMVASTRERQLRTLLEQPVDDLDAALDVTSTHLYLSARRKAHQQIRNAGAFVVDVEPKQLPTHLVSGYLDIKRAGLL